jgi:hypothetical protein
MTATHPDAPAAFGRLQRALLRRRFEAVDPRLRVELAAVGALVAGFLFWKERLRLAGLAIAGGPRAVSLDTAASLALLAVVGGALAGGRHALRLRGDRPGPPWLALPVPVRLVHRHLAWDSRVHALWAAPPALGVIGAAAGLVPAAWLPVLAAGFALALLGASRLACDLVTAVASRGVAPRAGLDPLTGLLATGARRARAGAARRGRWRREPAWRAFMRKDLLVALRPGPARARLAPPLLFGALSIAARALPIAPPIAHFAAFALALACAASWAEWIIAVTAGDPFPVAKSLPIGLGVAWGARVAWAALAGLALVAGHALAGRALDPGPLGLFLAWTGGAALGIGVLGANYGITLYPRGSHAQRLLALSLGVALAASLMLPLLGWVVLLTAIAHSLRRLPRWARAEAD